MEERYLTMKVLAKSFFFCVLIALILLGCGNQVNSNHKQQSSTLHSFDSSISYAEIRKAIATFQTSAAQTYGQTNDKNTFIKQIVRQLDSSIYFKLIPYWKGTPWTFTGHTDTPGNGTVACGYFVSTTLKHAGFNLNRFKLAQAASKQAGEKLVGKGNLKVLTCSPQELRTYMMKNNQPGLYFLGLDFHEAYLWLTNDELFIVHSNYINNEGVTQEKALESSALAASNSFWFAPIGGSATLTKKWLLKSKIN